MKHRDFLITGHERSGTGYMSWLFHAHGYDVGHERVKSDGISSAQFAVPNFVAHGYKRADYQFKYLIHVVREPILVLDSAFQTIMNPDLPSLHARHGANIPQDGTMLERMAWSVIEWNRIISAQRPHAMVQVEHAAWEMPLVAEKLGFDWEIQADMPPDDVNTRPRKREPVSWEELQRKLGPYTLIRFKDWTLEAGYEVPA